MKIKTSPFGQTLSFVEKLENRWKYITLEKDSDGHYDLPDNVQVATRCFVTAEYCLESLKIPVVLLGEDDHDDHSPNGVLLSLELHRLLTFAYRDFRYTGVMTVKEYSPEVNQFYCYMTKVHYGVGYIQPMELQHIVQASGVRITRKRWVAADGKAYMFTSLTTEKCLVFSKTLESEKHIPCAYFMVIKDNAPVRFARNMYPSLFKNLSAEIDFVQVLYSRAVSGYSMAPNVVVTSFNVFGDVLTWKVMFDAASDKDSAPSAFPPTLTEVLDQAF